MKENLFIFDVSPFLHAGHVNKAAKFEQLIQTGATWSTQVTPLGGTSLLFNTIYEVLGKGDCVFCCDRNPTIKKDMLPTYKNNRKHAPDMLIEKAAAEYILEKCNCTVIARQGYEADDIIYTLVQKLHDDYEHIYIYTGDSDMYFLVDETVSIKPSSSRAKEVTLSNYNQVLAKHGDLYNNATVRKICYGDTSDCIPGIPKDVRDAVMSVLFLPNMLPNLGDKKFVKDWFNIIAPDYASRVDLVFPLYVDNIPTQFNVPDRTALCNFGDAMNNRSFRGTGDPDFDCESYIVDMQKQGIYLEE